MDEALSPATNRIGKSAGALAVAAIATASMMVADWLRHRSSPEPHVLHMAGATPSPAAQGARPATKATLVSCEKLPHVPGQSVTTVLVHFPPDGYSPRHRHAGSVTAYVLKGTVRSQLNNGPIGTFTVGQSFFEPPGTIHTFAENASKTEPAEILATFVADDCAQLTTYLD